MYISCHGMKKMDQFTITSIGIPSIVLMERASLEFLEEIPNDLHKFTIVCGVGNNGGDGLAIARHLALKGKKVDIFLIGNLEDRTEDFNTNLNILKNLGIDFQILGIKPDLDKLESSLENSDCLIDSIFGLGLTRNITGLFYDTIEYINKKAKHIISVDLPSGLNGDTGEVMGISVIPNKTVTFHHPKIGLKDRPQLTGQVVVKDIGIPEYITEKFLDK